MASSRMLSAGFNCLNASSMRRISSSAPVARPQQLVANHCQRLHWSFEVPGASSSRQVARQRLQAASSEALHAAAHDEDEVDEEEVDMASASSSGQLPLDLPVPDKYYQKKLGVKEIKPLRTQSNTLAKDGTIQRITCGQKGVTQTFLQACADSLCKHGFLRVKLGEGSGLDRDEAAHALERYLDAVAVHQIGFTITLYRELGLPRPSNVPEAVQPVVAVEVEVPEKPELGTEGKPRVPRNRANARSAERAAAAKAAAKSKPKGPPEFSIV